MKKLLRKKVMGRPKTTVKQRIEAIPLNLDRIKHLYTAGWDDARVSAFLEVSIQTLDNWKKQDKTFFGAIKDWKKTADARVERSMYEKACGYSHPQEEIFCKDGLITRVTTIKHYAPDTVACIFWLKNRQPERWKETPLVNNTILNAVQNINPAKQLKEEELDDVLKHFASQREGSSIQHAG
jgi:hypothetical protein